MTPPKDIDWDLWIGPRTSRPFHDVYLPGPKWIDGGTLRTARCPILGSHFNDLPFWALKLDHPRTIQAFGPPPHKELAPASMTALSTNMSARRSARLHGLVVSRCRQTANLEGQGNTLMDNGILFIGSEGMLLSDYDRHCYYPKANLQTTKAPAILASIARTTTRVA